MNTTRAIALTVANVAFGASLVFGFATVAHADAPGPGIVTDSTGQLRDCTVTDAAGHRADFHAECDAYWSQH